MSTFNAKIQEYETLEFKCRVCENKPKVLIKYISAINNEPIYICDECLGNPNESNRLVAECAIPVCVYIPKSFNVTQKDIIKEVLLEVLELVYQLTCLNMSMRDLPIPVEVQKDKLIFREEN